MFFFFLFLHQSLELIVCPSSTGSLFVIELKILPITCRSGPELHNRNVDPVRPAALDLQVGPFWVLQSGDLNLKVTVLLPSVPLGFGTTLPEEIRLEESVTSFQSLQTCLYVMLSFLWHFILLLFCP